MGTILSSDTIYAVAYLTDLGRKYLFDPINNNRFILDANNGIIDAFKPVYFSMSDPDYNYNANHGVPLESGDISNISGKNDGCIKGTVLTQESNLISVNGEVNGITNVEDSNIPEVETPYVLSTDIPDGVAVININEMPKIPYDNPS